MKNNKRVPRSYKIKADLYKTAKKRAKKDGGTVSALLENVVTAYANGLDIKAIKITPGQGTALDIFSTKTEIK